MGTKTTAKGTELPILNLRGKDYLEVKWRLVWFREDHPDWTIETFIVRSDDNSSVVMAKISNEQGRLMATAHKSETKKGFEDHLEKAETGSIGRALALLGYGTQFTDDLDEKDRIVDAPVEPKKPQPKPIPNMAPGGPKPDNENALKALNLALLDCGFEGDARTKLLKDVYGVSAKPFIVALDPEVLLAGVEKIKSLTKPKSPAIQKLIDDTPNFNDNEKLPF